MFAKSRVALLLTLFYLGHSKRATESRSDVELQSNASAGRLAALGKWQEKKVYLAMGQNPAPPVNIPISTKK